MTVLNAEKLEKHIINWIREEAKKRQAKKLIVGCSDDINSLLAAVLCKKSGIKTECAYYFAHESRKSLERDHADMCEESTNRNLKMVLDPKEGDSIAFCNKNSAMNEYVLAGLWRWYTDTEGGIFVGVHDREEYIIDRQYQPYRDGIADIMPLADLFKTELKELAHAMGLLESDVFVEVYKPTMLEWIDRENERCAIIGLFEDPSRHRAWQGYTGEQRKAVALVHQKERATRWKHNPSLPICEIRDTPPKYRENKFPKGLVR